ncbi:MAG: DUF5060 domain-containing protein [Planctomycetota bacterium]|nr:DUF5060 domain-containing protein [Planctomycetota bacterium]
MNLPKVLVTASLVVFSVVAWQRFLPFKDRLDRSTQGDSESADGSGVKDISFQPTVLSERQLQLTSRMDKPAKSETGMPPGMMKDTNPSKSQAATGAGEIEEGLVVPVEGNADTASGVPEPEEQPKEKVDQSGAIEDAVAAEGQKPKTQDQASAAETVSTIPDKSTSAVSEAVTVNPLAKVEDKVEAIGETAIPVKEKPKDEFDAVFADAGSKKGDGDSATPVKEKPKDEFDAVFADAGSKKGDGEAAVAVKEKPKDEFDAAFENPKTEDSAPKTGVVEAKATITDIPIHKTEGAASSNSAVTAIDDKEKKYAPPGELAVPASSVEEEAFIDVVLEEPDAIERQRLPVESIEGTTGLHKDFGPTLPDNDTEITAASNLEPGKHIKVEEVLSVEVESIGHPFQQHRAPARYAYDDFEDQLHWGHESAEDQARLELTTQNASEGHKCLKLTYERGQKGKFEIRREVFMKLPQTIRFTMDVFSPREILDTRLVVMVSQKEWLRFESESNKIRPGWNRSLSFVIDPVGGQDSNAQKWVENLEDVIRISWVFAPLEDNGGAIYLDNIRLDSDPEAATRGSHGPVIYDVRPSAEKVERYQALELAIDAQLACTNVFDRSEVDLIGTFFSPSGEKRTVHGFAFDFASKSSPRTDWRMRFAPDETGAWEYFVEVKDKNGKAVSRRGKFACVRTLELPGKIRISERDPRYFEFENGQIFYPIGQNIAWSSSMGSYFKSLEANGCNTTRVWMCPWHLQLEGPKNPGYYNPENARRFDEILSLAEGHGLHLMLVMEYHGMHLGDWSRNPYNFENGGPCAKPFEFFTLKEAKELFKRRLQYIVARWGHSSSIFAWELWNEVDLAADYKFLVEEGNFKQIIEWHREMGAYLKTLDSYGHLVTTSTSNSNRFDDIYLLEEIDFIPKHFYSEKIVEEVVLQYKSIKDAHKPYFVAEFAGGTDPRHDQEDTRGLRLHAGLWAAMMTQSAGSALPWWWDIHIQKYDLYHHYKALATFAKGEDPRGKQLQFFTDQVVSNQQKVDIVGTFTRTEATFWVYNRKALETELSASNFPVLATPIVTALSGLISGNYTVEIWDTWTGRRTASHQLEAGVKGLQVELPKSDRDFAVKIRRQDQVTEPSIRFFTK